jgi:hypothetical protein
MLLITNMFRSLCNLHQGSFTRELKHKKLPNCLGGTIQPYNKSKDMEEKKNPSLKG